MSETFGEEDYLSTTLTELSKRIVLEKKLKSEIARLTDERNDLQIKLEQSQAPDIKNSEYHRNDERTLRDEIATLKHHHAVISEQQAEKVRKLAEEGNAELQQARERLEFLQEVEATKSCLESENSRLLKEHCKVECALREEIVRLTDQHAVVLERQVEKLRKVTEDCNTELQQAREQLELLRELGAAKMGLESENARLSEENACKERALRELEDVRLSNQDLVEEITSLKKRNAVLVLLKISAPQPARRLTVIPQGIKRVNAPGRLLASSPCRQRTDALDRLLARGPRPSLLNIIPDNIKKPEPSKPLKMTENDDEESVYEISSGSEDGAVDGLADDGSSQDDEAQGVRDRGLPTGLQALPDRVLPRMRCQALACPSFPAILPERKDVVIFNRDFLHGQLGGGLIALQVRIASGKQQPLAKQFGISAFMCPNLDHNPWAPSSPGESGFMFVGLGKEEGAFAIQETHEVFVQFAPKQMFYAGRYCCKKVQDLEPKEWCTLDMKIKRKYCETTISKAKEKGVIDTVLAQYNGGRLRAPCVRLTCVGYSWDLYNALSDAAKRAHPPDSGSPSSSRRNQLAKRKCVNEEDTEPETPHRYETRKKRACYVDWSIPSDFGPNRQGTAESELDDIFM